MEKEKQLKRLKTVIFTLTDFEPKTLDELIERNK